MSRARHIATRRSILAKEPQPGDLFAGYRIETEIGRGGMGVVYLAEHLRLKQRRALKLLPEEYAEDENFRARFERESQLAASLEHPAIVPIHDAGEVDGILYIAMRYVPGSDLKEIIASEGRMAPDRVIALLEQIGDALDTAHESGLVHRDVKPQNTLVSPARSARDREHAYLTDFGLTKRYDSKTGLTSAGMMVGTADYMSPEQLRSQDVDGRSDIYALGCMFYECLVGTVPFESPSITAAIMAHMSKPPPNVTDARPDLPPYFDYVVATAMAKEKGDRFQSCGDLIGAAKEGLRILQQWGPPPSATVVAGGGYATAPSGTEISSSPGSWGGDGGGTVASVPPADTQASDGGAAPAAQGVSAEAQQQTSDPQGFPGQGSQGQTSDPRGYSGPGPQQQDQMGGPQQWGPGPYSTSGPGHGRPQPDRRKMAILAGSGVGLLLVIVLAFVLLSGGEPEPPPPGPEPDPGSTLTSLFQPKSQTTFPSDLSTLLPDAIGPFQFQTDLDVDCVADPAARSAGKEYVSGGTTLSLIVCDMASPEQAREEMDRTLDTASGEGLTPSFDPPSTPVLDESGNQIGEAFTIGNQNNGKSPGIVWTNGTLNGALVCRPNCEINTLYDSLEF